MSLTRKLTCISCPIGCTLTLTIDGKDLTNISGNQCPRGLNYAKDEFYNPKRMLTSTIKIENGVIQQLPVRTKEPIPKEKIPTAMKILKDLTARAPVNLGEIIDADFAGTKVALIATRSVKEKS